MKDYITHHVLICDLAEKPLDGRHVADALLDAAAELGASYIVMGAYGHSRLRGAVLGGATRELLHKSHFPLLLAH